MIAGPPWILVDVGQVLIGFEHAIVSERIQVECFPGTRQTAQDREALDRFIFSSSGSACPNGALDRGTRALDWLCELVRRRFDVGINQAHFAEIWSSIFLPELNEDVLGCIGRLRMEGASVAICSNTNAAHWSFLRRQHARFRQLTDEVRCFLSFEMGLCKVDPGFFQQIVESTRAPARSHLLLDDRLENCLAAEGAGMQAVLFDPSDAQRSLDAVMTFFEGGAGHGE
jgi:FMN phosphatase YigB (HAD superfamily)